jgi:hypothetical protein
MILTIAWNPLEFHVVDALPKRKTFNVTHYVEHILVLILALRPKSGWRHLVIHTDNAMHHIARRSQTFCNSNSLRIVLPFLYSPDLVP